MTTLPPDAAVRISMLDMPRGGDGMIAYEIVGDTSMRVQREVARIVDRIGICGGFAMFRDPTRSGDVWIARGYIIETKEG